MTVMRKPVVAGNWKMYKCGDEAAMLAEAVARGASPLSPSVDTVICPPFPALVRVAGVLRSGSVALGAQNMHWENEGAYTGEVAPPMLVDAGCRYVILGHSERRTCFHETDQIVNRKTHAAMAAGLVPIVCVGETLEERETGKTRKVIETQVAGSLKGIGTDLSGIIVAYEPVWAIGTGLTATPEQAQEVHAFIRICLEKIDNRAAAQKTRILYGGSVKPANAGDLFRQPDIDGGLIGGAALDAETFLAVVKAAVV